MAKFYVGQHVRIVAPGYAMDGRETKVTAVDVYGMDFGRGFWGVEVDIPHGEGWPRYVFEYHDLEPITRPHQSCESEFKESLDQLLGKLTENA